MSNDAYTEVAYSSKTISNKKVILERFCSMSAYFVSNLLSLAFDKSNCIPTDFYNLKNSGQRILEGQRSSLASHVKQLCSAGVDLSDPTSQCKQCFQS